MKYWIRHSPKSTRTFAQHNLNLVLQWKSGIYLWNLRNRKKAQIAMNVRSKPRKSASKCIFDENLLEIVVTVLYQLGINSL